jgi:hypothetical protein
MTEDKSRADAADQDHRTPHRALTMFLLGLVLLVLVALVGRRCPSDYPKCCGYPGWVGRLCFGQCVRRCRSCSARCS